MPSPKAYVDARMVDPVPHGFARYVTLLARGLDELRAADGELPYRVVFMLRPGMHARVAEHPVFSRFETIPVDAPFLSLRELLVLPRVLKRDGAALYHSPTFASLAVCPCPWVQTVHDLNHLQYGGWREKAYYRALLAPFARRARVLATVSEFSRRELARWLGSPEASIEIAWNALDPILGEAISPQLTADLLAGQGLERGRYFFCLSNPKPHKNLERLFAAYAAYRSRQPDGWKLATNVERPAAAGVVSVGSLDDAASRALIAASGAFVFPSLYEGFGLPPVEAATLGAPVIASRIPAHLEGLRDLGPEAVAWVEPGDDPGWVDALTRAAAGGLRQPTAAERAALLSRFEPVRLGRHMDRIYRRVLDLPMGAAAT